ncbi:hypothetical protein GCM10022206_35060 [Streptomyces chiangmaiensis]
MTGCTRWKDIRAEHVERAGGEAAVVEGKRELSAEVLGHRVGLGKSSSQVKRHTGIR